MAPKGNGGSSVKKADPTFGKRDRWSSRDNLQETILILHQSDCFFCNRKNILYPITRARAIRH